MKLRPHHLLCTLAYRGKGYSEEFILYMNKVVNEIRNNDNLKLNIVFDTDDLCSKCPNKVRDGICITNEKVVELDKGVVNLLNLTEKEYNYSDLKAELFNMINEEEIDKICGKCSWYEDSNCKKYIINSLQK